MSKRLIISIKKSIERLNSKIAPLQTERAALLEALEALDGGEEKEPLTGEWKNPISAEIVPPEPKIPGKMLFSKTAGSVEAQNAS